MTGIVMFSGGIGSWMAARTYVKNGGGVKLLFCDTLIEDEDLYRFVLQGSANILKLKCPEQLLEQCWQIPDLDRTEARKKHLKTLAWDAMQQLPGLVWLADGRTPWQVFRDNRMIGNSMAAPCSHELKQDIARSWLQKNYQPEDIEIVLGIDWRERHRYDGPKGAKDKWLPWKVVAPLCDKPHWSKQEMLMWLEAEEITPPRLYDMGFPHNNCGGFCVRAGFAAFRLLLKEMPERYSYHEKMEQEMRQFLNKDVSIMRDRRVGKPTVPLTMVDFRQKNRECGESWGGCGCFLE